LIPASVSKFLVDLEKKINIQKRQREGGTGFSGRLHQSLKGFIEADPIHQSG
jgi:hypothetical protein